VTATLVRVGCPVAVFRHGIQQDAPGRQGVRRARRRRHALPVCDLNSDPEGLSFHRNAQGSCALRRLVAFPRRAVSEHEIRAAGHFGSQHIEMVCWISAAWRRHACALKAAFDNGDDPLIARQKLPKIPSRRLCRQAHIDDCPTPHNYRAQRVFAKHNLDHILSPYGRSRGRQCRESRQPCQHPATIGHKIRQPMRRDRFGTRPGLRPSSFPRARSNHSLSTSFRSGWCLWRSWRHLQDWR
jgi:hypothetical protein